MASDTMADAELSAPALTIDICQATPGDVIVEVHGELDMATGPVLTQEVRQVLEASPGVRRLVLDLAALRFVDVVGLRALERSAAIARSFRARQVLVSPPSHVMRVVAALQRPSRGGRSAPVPSRSIRSRRSNRSPVTTAQ